ncbi:MAG: amidohydrolase family protein [Rhodocyclaceae bacterium]
MTSLLIKNAAAILTGAHGTDERHPGPDIRITDGKIAALGQLNAQTGERILDATDCVVYPAWVNTHHHLFQALLKGDPYGIDQPLTSWLAATPYRYRATFNETRFRLAARIGLIELALSGCATIADHNYMYYPGMSFDASAILFDEADKLGLRFVLCRGGATITRQLEAELPSALRAEKFDDYLADMERLVAQYHDAAPDGMRRVVMAPTTPPHSMSPAELREAAATARRLGIRLHSHLSETVNYQDVVHAKHRTSPIRFAAEIDWLGSDVWFAHLVKLDDDEIALLGQTGTGIAHCPQSNGRLASGIAPVMALEAAGAPVSIGVDGAASNEAADMISETHAAWLMQRAAQGDRARALYRGGEGEPARAAPRVEDVVRWGTAGGARILGLEAIGTLAPGRAADIAVYRLDDDPRYFGIHDVGIAPVACGGRARLKALLVGGRTVVAEGTVAGVDMAALAAEARRAVRDIVEAAA